MLVSPSCPCSPRILLLLRSLQTRFQPWTSARKMEVPRWLRPRLARAARPCPWPIRVPDLATRSWQVWRERPRTSVPMLLRQSRICRTSPPR
eukprot:symbB.v1.2.031890.t1/scaffold3749.1/size50967/5